MNKKPEPTIAPLDEILNSGGPIRGANPIETAPPIPRKPTPGSEDGIKAGCICPVDDNKNGTGAWDNTDTGEPMFFIEPTCPVHGHAVKSV